MQPCLGAEGRACACASTAFKRGRLSRRRSASLARAHARPPAAHAHTCCDSDSAWYCIRGLRPKSPSTTTHARRRRMPAHGGGDDGAAIDDAAIRNDARPTGSTHLSIVTCRRHVRWATTFSAGTRGTAATARFVVRRRASSRIAVTRRRSKTGQARPQGLCRAYLSSGRALASQNRRPDRAALAAPAQKQRRSHVTVCDRRSRLVTRTEPRLAHNACARHTCAARSRTRSPTRVKRSSPSHPRRHGIAVVVAVVHRRNARRSRASRVTQHRATLRDAVLLREQHRPWRRRAWGLPR